MPQTIVTAPELEAALSPVIHSLGRGNGGTSPLDKKIGFLQYLNSAVSQSKQVKTKFDTMASNGRIRTVQLNVWPRISDSDVSNDITDLNCAPGPESAARTINAPLNGFSIMKRSFKEKYLRQVLDEGTSFATFARDEMAQMARALRTDINTKLLTKAGTFPAAYPNLQLLNNQNAVDVVNMFTVANTFEDEQLGGTPYAFGMGLLRLATQLRGISAANDAGLNVGTLDSFGFEFMKDQTAAAALGDANRILLALPGFLQWYTYNEYDGDDFKERNILSYPARKTMRFQMTDPVISSLKYDGHIIFDECTDGTSDQGTYTISMWLHYDLMEYPYDLAFGDDPALVNSRPVRGYTITQQAPAV
jgi:hypothetical protein